VGLGDLGPLPPEGCGSAADVCKLYYDEVEDGWCLRTRVTRSPPGPSSRRTSPPDDAFASICRSTGRAQLATAVLAPEVGACPLEFE
jgi:hypothetical protein